MFVLVGYSVAGLRIVVVVRSGQMWLSRRVVAGSRHDGGEPSGDTCELVSLYRALKRAVLFDKVCD